MRIRIRTKITAGYILVVLLLVILILYSMSVNQKSLQESIGNGSIFLAEEILNRIEQSTYLKMEELQRHSFNHMLQKTVSESNMEFEELDNTEEYINQKDREWISTPEDEITPFMHELIGNELSNELREGFIRFYAKEYGYDVFEVILVTNKYGANVAQTGKDTDYRQDDEEWWQVARERGFYIGDVEYDEIAETHGISIGVRVDDREGNFMGVIKALVGAKEIIREAEITLKKYETTGIQLITRNGRLIYATGAFKFLEDVSQKEFFKKIKGESDFFIAERGGREKLFSHVRSKGYRGFDGHEWIFIVEHDTDEVLKPAFVLRKNTVVVAFILIILSIFIALLISRSISKPVTEVRNAAVEIAQGNLEKRVEVISKDEIGELAGSFNEMAVKLKEFYTSLEEKVHERTIELEEANEQLKNEITKRKQAEEKLREYSENLEKLVEERTKELKEAQEQLVRKEKLAVIGQLASGVGHELRNPIGVISNSVYYLNMKLKDADERVKKHLDILVREVGRSNDIITDLLDFSRVRPPSFEEADVNNIVKETLTVIEVPENITLETELDEYLTRILVDPAQIRQMILNIISDAFGAMPEGGRLEIKAEEKKDFVEIMFKDTGEGISKENLPKIFEPLFTTRAKGIGLGLAIVKGIVESHRGRIEVESEVAKGTTFTVKLPLKGKKRS